MRSLLQLQWALLPLFWSTVAAQTPIGACNNSPDLCSRTYDNVTHLGAHDSPFLRDSTTQYSTAGNQFYNSTVQLESGVRLLSAQVHEFTNSSTNLTEWHLCHTDCVLLDAGPLSLWLSEIKTWMDANPNDVVTVLLVNSNNMNAQQLDAEFAISGIREYAYVPVSTTTAPRAYTWPTLGAMINANQRLVTFVASLDPNANAVAPYLMDEFTFVFENPFEVTDANNFTCTPDRPVEVQGSPQAAVNSNRMFLMNHFLDSEQAFGIETPDVDAISDTNGPNLGTPGGLGQHMANCMAQYRRAPTFAIVDFANVGPAIQTVDIANGVLQPLGRSSLSTAIVQEVVENAAGMTKGRAWADGSSRFAFLVALVVTVGLASWAGC